MAEPYVTYKPSTDFNWLCEEHGLAFMNSGVMGIAQALGILPVFTSIDQLIEWSAQTEQMKDVIWEKSTSDKHPCRRCQQRDAGLENLLSQPAQE